MAIQPNDFKNLFLKDYFKNKIDDFIYEVQNNLIERTDQKKVDTIAKKVKEATNDAWNKTKAHYRQTCLCFTMGDCSQDIKNRIVGYFLKEIKKNWDQRLGTKLLSKEERSSLENKLNFDDWIPLHRDNII